MNQDAILKLKDGREYRRGEIVLRKKAKVFYAVVGHPELWIMRHLNVVTADDDGSIQEEIPGKGELNAKISEMLFELLSGQYSDEHHCIPIRTHYIGASMNNPTECLIRRMSQPIPLEVIVRNYAYGSYLERTHYVEGTPLEPPVCEFTRKDDKNHDPLITEQEIIQEGIATDIEVAHMQETALAVNQIMHVFFREIGIELADFKLVFGRLGNVVGDYTNLRIIGELSPDICRLRDMNTGQCLDKDIFRQELPGLSEAYTMVLQRMAEYREQEEWRRHGYRTHDANGAPLK